MRKFAPIAAAVIAGMLVIGYLVWRSQPEQVLKRQCKTLMGMADEVGNGVGIFDIKRLENLLADQVVFQIDVVDEEPFRAGQIEVISAYRWLGGNVEKSNFMIVEFTSVEIEGDEARLDLKVAGTLEMPDMRMLEGEHAAGFLWQKDEEGDWRLTEFSFR